MTEGPVLDIHTVTGVAQSALQGGQSTLIIRSYFLVVSQDGPRLIPQWLPAEDCHVCASVSPAKDDGAQTIYLE